MDWFSPRFMLWMVLANGKRLEMIQCPNQNEWALLFPYSTLIDVLLFIHISIKYLLKRTRGRKNLVRTIPMHSTLALCVHSQRMHFAVAAALECIHLTKSQTHRHRQARNHSSARNHARIVLGLNCGESTARRINV